MDCEKTRTHLLLALYGEVRDDERDAAARHIEACAACRAAEADEHVVARVVTFGHADGLDRLDHVGVGDP
ncbi:MAG TPA: hypothetical protein VJV75_08800, partial [Candidatus Polarisedimenticolia bacterium]|nr:hypothetical protein [Candidatus Polarisedimenticolia bacterium]